MDPTTIIFIVLLVVLVIALLVVPMFTNKKRAKQTDELHRSLQPGDLIKTVGGIIGTIKEIRQISPTDREMIIETGEGDNKTTMTFDIQALYQVMSRSATAVAAKEELDLPDEEPEKNAEEPKTEEQAPRVVPDILADREAAEEKNEDVPAVEASETAAVETPEKKEDQQEQSKAEEAQPALAEQKAEKPAAKKSNGAAKKPTAVKKSK